MIEHSSNILWTDRDLVARESFEQVIFDYEVLRNVTRNFGNNNVLGEGGFGKVYKGNLPDGRQDMSTSWFMSICHTIALINIYSGISVILLIGRPLRPHSGMQALGTPRGLAYLHEDSNVRIVHRDIKCGNIHLNDQFHPKITDFGLAKFFPKGQTHLSSREQVLRVITIARLCAQGNAVLQSLMSQVMSMLRSDSEIVVRPTRPAFISDNGSGSGRLTASAMTSGLNYQ
eukprot:Gb_02559 [translate_table: standard]